MLTKRGNSYQASFTVAGKRHRQSFKTEKEATLWRRRLELAVDSGEDTGVLLSRPIVDQKETHTLQDLFLITHQTRWAALRTTSMTELGSRVVDTLSPGKLVTEITHAVIVKMVIELRAQGLSQSTVNRRLAALSMMLKLAVDMEWIPGKPRIPFAKEHKKERRWLTPEEEQRILSRLVGTPVHGLVVVAVETGCRISELVHLRWRDVGVDRISLTSTKNGRCRGVPLTLRAREVMEGIARDGEGPFTRLSVSESSRKFKKAATEAGILDEGVVFHSLRHTCASRLVMAGVDVRRVQLWMGHSCIQSTLVYAHLAPSSMEDVVLLMDRLEDRRMGRK
jgi:integrase